MKQYRPLVSLIGMVGGLLLALPVEAAQFRTWRFDPQQNRLEFSTDAAVQPRAQLLFNPTRIVVDLPGTTLEQRTINQVVGGAVQAVRIGQFDAQTTRLVIELAPGYTLNSDQVVVRGETPQQWVVQLPAPAPIGSMPPQSLEPPPRLKAYALPPMVFSSAPLGQALT